MAGSETVAGDHHGETPHAAPVLSTDELHSVVFIIRAARAIGLLQALVPSKYLPPPEDRVPSELLHRLIRELKKLVPKWRWTRSSQPLPRSPKKLGDEFFYAIAALRMSRGELLRGGYRESVAALDDAYSLLFAIGVRAQERKRQSRSKLAERAEN